jgi:5-formyltetrahydrofolate cyclo-ligase
MDSIGSGEILVIAVVALLAIDPKTAGRWWGRMRGLFGQLQQARAALEREMRTAAEPASVEPGESPQARLRSWSKRRVDELGQTEFDQAGARMLGRLREWEPYRTAEHVSAFCSIRLEVPTWSVLAGILADGKTIWLPRTTTEPGRMEMVRVSNLETELQKGRWGLLEPSGPAEPVPEGILVLVPGEVFDLHGGRIGKGGGYYDRWLADHPGAIAVGTAWDRQVHPGRLPQTGTDRPMTHLLTPERFVHFAPENEKGSGGSAPGETVEDPNA